MLLWQQQTKLISDQRYYYIAGGAIVLGIIAVCLFPLWPMEARQVEIHKIHLQIFTNATLEQSILYYV